MTYGVEDRERITKRVIEGLSQGIPLAVLCREDRMCGVSTFYEWMEADAGLSGAIARAREQGFDAIAADCLAIADETGSDTKIGQDGRPTADSEWISRSRLRVETRLKLLAKWDPKRYGDKTLVGSDPENPLPAGFSVTLVKAQKPDEER